GVRGLERQARGQAEGVGVDLALEILVADAADVDLALERIRLHWRGELQAHAVAPRVLLAVRGIRLRDARRADGRERGGARLREHAAARGTQALVDGDDVLRLALHPRRRVEREDGAVRVPRRALGDECAVGAV